MPYGWTTLFDGEVETEMVFDDLRKNSEGYSDPTGLHYTITTRLDIATIYGSNFCEFGMNPWHKSLEDNLKILEEIGRAHV